MAIPGEGPFFPQDNEDSPPFLGALLRATFFGNAREYGQSQDLKRSIQIKRGTRYDFHYTSKTEGSLSARKNAATQGRSMG